MSLMSDEFTKIEQNKDKISELYQQIALLEAENLMMEEHINKKDDHKFEFELNESQKAAVESTTENSIIIACPGSGKTHTLIAKTVYLIKVCNVDPQQIILITFTKKAASEMRERLAQKLGQTKIRYVGTLHGLAYRALQKYDDINYTILDDKDSKKALDQHFFKLADGRFKDKYNDDTLSMLHKVIHTVHELLCARYPESLDNILKQIKQSNYEDIIRRTMRLYGRYKIKNKYLDFNDLMIKFVEFIQDARSEEFKKSYSYILFDEYQDINSIQDLILHKMNEYCKNLTVVGDDAQSIYAFRGSEVKFILNFTKNYENANVTKLEHNYRSTPEIINLCNAVIQGNNEQLKKNMISIKKSIHIKPKITGFNTVINETNYVVGKIVDLMKNGISLKEIAIISRTNRQLDCFEFELIKNKVNYIKSKGIGILDRLHTKDFLSFLIVLINKESQFHWRRILNLVQGVGAVTTEKLLKENKNFFDTTNLIMEPKSKKLMKNLLDILKKVEEEYKNDNLEKLCSVIIEFLEPVIEKRAKIKDDLTHDEKVGDLHMLTSILIKINDLPNFLADIHLTEDVDVHKSFDQEKKEHILLTTIHGAKGLEFDYVFVIGASSDMLPSIKSTYYLEEIEDVEEERRLFYVATSRARKALEITLCYDYHFVTNYVYASPFIKELKTSLYTKKNIRFATRLYEGDVTHIINNYLLTCSSSKVYPYLKNLPNTYTSMYIGFADEIVNKMKLQTVRGTFIDLLLTKMIYTHYNDHINAISVPIYDRYNIHKDNHYFNYIDPSNHWSDCLNTILRISILKTKLGSNYKQIYDIIAGEKQIALYTQMEKAILNIVSLAIKEAKIKKNDTNAIQLHFNLSLGNIMGEADIVAGKTLIEIKASHECIATTKYLLQTIIYTALLEKKGIRIETIVLFNPVLGEMYTFNVGTNWGHIEKVFEEVLYKD
jgi:DNA helicase II / ATP-dependent DNA helicase PcrA